ncbi:hypothetical protein [Streptomyces luteogriseus]|uniref:hypothetical protein n=1 Tax=Streptomyces luteogriseus TaxID=68233 RepID=UPI00379C2C1E
MNETTNEVREWIDSFDANRDAVERASFGPVDDFENEVRELAAMDPEFHWDVEAIEWAELQSAVRSRVRINDQTGTEWLTEQFEFELCAECHGDVDDHRASPDMFGNWHAWCLFNAPRMMHFVTSINPALGNSRPVRLERVDNGEIVAEVTKSPAHREYSRQRLTYGSANDIPDESLKVAAQELLQAYRRKKHNES